MLRWWPKIVFSFVLVLVGSMANIVSAQTPAGRPAQGIQFLLVDVDSVFGLSKVGKNLNEQMRDLKISIKGQLEKEETLLLKEKAALEKESAAPPADFQKKVDQYGKKANAQQNKTDAYAAALGKAADEAQQAVLERIKNIIAEVSKEKNIPLVLNSRAVILHPNPEEDITQIVLQKLDEQLPTLAVNFVDPAASNTTPAAPAQPAAAQPAPKKKK